MRRHRLQPDWALLIAAAFLLGGCDRPPAPSQAIEWTAKDHDRLDESAKVATGEQVTGKKGSDDNALAEITWGQQCAPCHGILGRGDGPSGPMLKTPNFSLPSWQTSRSDAELAATIRNGKGRMPKFDLPDDVIKLLIKQIRIFGDSKPTSKPEMRDGGSGKATSP